jgi:hypothetical protein
MYLVALPWHLLLLPFIHLVLPLVGKMWRQERLSSHGFCAWHNAGYLPHKFSRKICWIEVYNLFNSNSFSYKYLFFLFYIYGHWIAIDNKLVRGWTFCADTSTVLLEKNWVKFCLPTAFVPGHYWVDCRSRKILRQIEYLSLYFQTFLIPVWVSLVLLKAYHLE